MKQSTNRYRQVADKMAPLTLPALNGDLVDLQTLQGKKYILFMWASW
jgi:hypothetical protein